MLSDSEREALQRIAKGVAAQFGSGCEVVVHEISEKSAYHSIIAIENGHVTGRKLGDGPSHVVLEQLGKTIDAEKAQDHFCYLTKTPDGKILKSSTVYIRDNEGKVAALFCINFDISALTMVDSAISGILAVQDQEQKEPERINLNVNDLLDDLIRQSDELVGKPVAMMTKDDKVKAIQFLNQSGALLITKSGDKIAKHFGISKYTLYSYLDIKQEEKTNVQN
ncbi:MAG: helix-turn-helix transcriptional regulator [Clostridia bacterium]|nr:helix-turn-helix transcriptional regulator [Clostridia bacterium]